MVNVIIAVLAAIAVALLIYYISVINKRSRLSAAYTRIVAQVLEYRKGDVPKDVRMYKLYAWLYDKDKKFVETAGGLVAMSLIRQAEKEVDKFILTDGDIRKWYMESRNAV